MQHKIKALSLLLVITILAIIVPKTTLSQSVIAEKAIIDYKIDTGIRLHPGLVRKITHGQIEKDIVQWVYDNFDTIGTGSNFANHDLTATGNRIHDFNSHDLKIKGIDKFVLQDAAGLKTFTITSANTEINIGDSLSGKGLLIDYFTGLVKNRFGNIQIGTGVINKTIIDSVSMSTYDITGILTSKIGSASGLGYIQLNEGSSGFSMKIQPNALTMNPILNSPNHSGTICTNDGLQYTSGPLISAPAVVITHGLSFTPSMIIPIADDLPSGVAISGCSVSAINPTTFTISFQSAFTGTLNIHWQAF